MRLIADGVVDREGVEGLARRVGYTPRHLTRLLTAELGAGPLALARAKRAQTARVLIETTDLSYADVAFAAGFSSVRQFNDTIREVYAATPDRAARPPRRPGRATGAVTMRLAVRTPFAGAPLLDFLATRAVPGVEAAGPGWYARTLALPHGTGTVRLDVPDVPRAGADRVRHARRSTLDDLRDTDGRGRAGPAAARRRLRPGRGRRRVRRRPGRRPAGPAPPRAAGARPRRRQRGRGPRGARPAGQRRRRAHRRPRGSPSAYGRPVAQPAEGLTHLFPDAATLAALDPEDLPMPRSRGRALVALCAALADGAIALDRGPDRDDVRARCSPSPASGRGPPTTSRCARSATPTSSCRPTSASATRSTALGPRPGATPPSSPSAGDRGAPTPSCTCGRP